MSIKIRRKYFPFYFLIFCEASFEATSAKGEETEGQEVGQDKEETIGNDGSSGKAVGKWHRARSTSPTPEKVNKAQSRTVRDCRHQITPLKHNAHI